MVKNKTKTFLKNVRDAVSLNKALNKALEEHCFDVKINGVVIDISCDKSIEEYFKKDSQCSNLDQVSRKAVKLQN